MVWIGESKHYSVGLIGWKVKLIKGGWNLNLNQLCLLWKEKFRVFHQVWLFSYFFVIKWQVCFWFWHIQVKSKLNKLKLNFDNRKEKKFKLSISNNQRGFRKLTFNDRYWLKYFDALLRPNSEQEREHPWFVCKLLVLGKILVGSGRGCILW